MSSSVSETTSPERFTGRVKWFNNKAGYGFVTVTDGPKAGSDIFIHHSSIKVDSEQYKYLVQGEYIEFEFAVTNGGEHEVQAGNVSGIKGGKLMCETRTETRVSRTQYKTSNPNEPTAEQSTRAPQHQSVRAPQQQSVRAPQQQSVRAPQETRVNDEGEWKFVYKTQQGSTSQQSSGRGHSDRGRGPSDRGRR